jgi:DNA polymerase III delta prime subunit
MPNFYISEILFLTKFAEQQQKNSLELTEIKDLVLNHLEKTHPQSLASKKNIFWYNSNLENFKIALAREIIQEAQYSNWSQEGIRILVLLNFETASLAAQNALLKLIEEPPTNTLIILPVVNSHRLLATINSRCSLCHINQDHLENEKEKITDEFFWPNNLAETFTIVSKYKDRETAKNFVKSLLEQKQLGYKEKKALTQAYLDLENNLNVRLALEHCFFSFFQ